MARIDAINHTIKNMKNAGVINSKEVSDTHHTFGTLYLHRLHLFAALCNMNPSISFKTRKHFDEENDPMFNEDFMAGIKTPKGLVTYHFKLEFWNLFKIQEIEKGPKYNGYTDKDIYERLDSLVNS